jgi:hypothetical protein
MEQLLKLFSLLMPGDLTKIKVLNLLADLSIWQDNKE